MRYLKPLLMYVLAMIVFQILWKFLILSRHDVGTWENSYFVIFHIVFALPTLYMYLEYLWFPYYLKLTKKTKIKIEGRTYDLFQDTDQVSIFKPQKIIRFGYTVFDKLDNYFLTDFFYFEICVNSSNQALVYTCISRFNESNRSAILKKRIVERKFASIFFEKLVKFN